MSIHKGKLIIGESIDFAGFTLNQQGVLPEKQKVDAIRNFPPPTSVTEVRSFLGLANQLGGFIENMAALSEPLRGLLRKGFLFKWTSDHQTAFERLRKKLASPALVHFLTPS